MRFDRLQCAGIFACDCVVEDEAIWVGVLILDPDQVETGQVHDLLDLAGDRTPYPIRLNLDYTPAYRHRLERVTHDHPPLQERQETGSD